MLNDSFKIQEEDGFFYIFYKRNTPTLTTKVKFALPYDPRKDGEIEYISVSMGETNDEDSNLFRHPAVKAFMFNVRKSHIELGDGVCYVNFLQENLADANVYENPHIVTTELSMSVDYAEHNLHLHSHRESQLIFYICYKNKNNPKNIKAATRKSDIPTVNPTISSKEGLSKGERGYTNRN